MLSQNHITCICKKNSVSFLSELPKSSKSKEKKKTESTDKHRPSVYFLLAMIVIFYVCGSVVRWNFVIVFFLSIVLGVFVYWFGSLHDVV